MAKDQDNVKDNPVEVKGKTDPGNSVNINDRFAIVSSDGSFSYLLNLSNGDNKIKIVAKDLAGNTETKEITIKASL